MLYKLYMNEQDFWDTGYIFYFVVWSWRQSWRRWPAGYLQRIGIMTVNLVFMNPFVLHSATEPITFVLVISRVGTKKNQPKTKQNSKHEKKTSEMGFLDFLFFFAIFHCKPCWWPKFDLKYFNALLKYESSVEFLLTMIK